MRSLPSRGVFALFALLSAFAGSACSPPADGRGPTHPASSSASTRPAASSSDPPPAPVVPVPETLAFTAGQFGLAMQAEGFTWKVLRRNVTRFDWSGRARDGSGEREVLYSFFMEKLDDTTSKLLPQIAESAAANLTEGEPCKALEQPREIVQKLGVDRIVTVCFAPSTFYGGKEHRHAVLHAIVHEGALTIVAVLSNDSMAIIPLPKIIGARGTPRTP